MHGIDFSEGPQFDRDLFTIPGRLARLHKGAKMPPPPSPVARQPLDDQTRAASSEREEQLRRRGYQSSVLTQFAADQGGKTVLG